MELEPIFNKTYLTKQKEISDNIIMLEHQITSFHIKKALNGIFFTSLSNMSYVISSLSLFFLIINFYLTNSFPTLTSNPSFIINLSTFGIYFLGACSTIFLIHKHIPFLKNIFLPVKNLLKNFSHFKDRINITQLEEKKETLLTQLESLRDHEEEINSLFSNMTFKNKSIEEVEHLMAFAEFKKCMLEDDLVGATTIVTNYFSDKNINEIHLHI